MCLAKNLREIADKWREENPDHQDGVVLIWQGSVYGWKNSLRDPAHEQPSAFAVDSEGHVFIAEGGNSYDGAKCWVAVALDIG
ncbi:antirestriction protein ArdR [Shewanella sp. M16]|uniref:antirestriction protein ArdR n=1 Tax=Shewanella sp. M16 TaxID=2830837 RepID=UPI001BAFF857|nr:antirestriction protein ArdR [Shewanella sp. M16]MBS0045138.1 antirestriction protein ArdR [Shewanella sp. M16]